MRCSQTPINRSTFPSCLIILSPHSSYPPLRMWPLGAIIEKKHRCHWPLDCLLTASQCPALATCQGPWNGLENLHFLCPQSAMTRRVTRHPPFQSFQVPALRLPSTITTRSPLNRPLYLNHHATLKKLWSLFWCRKRYALRHRLHHTRIRFPQDRLQLMTQIRPCTCCQRQSSLFLLLAQQGNPHRWPRENQSKWLPWTTWRQLMCNPFLAPRSFSRMTQKLLSLSLTSPFPIKSRLLNQVNWWLVLRNTTPWTPAWLQLMWAIYGLRHTCMAMKMGLLSQTMSISWRWIHMLPVRIKRKMLGLTASQLKSTNCSRGIESAWLHSMRFGWVFIRVLDMSLSAGWPTWPRTVSLTSYLVLYFKLWLWQARTVGRHNGE